MVARGGMGEVTIWRGSNLKQLGENTRSHKFIVPSSSFCGSLSNNWLGLERPQSQFEGLAPTCVVQVMKHKLEKMKDVEGC